jgi:hypothetical protein
MQASQQMIQAFMRVMDAISQTPILYGANGRPLAPTGPHGIRRESAGQSGSLKGWRPRHYLSVQEESRDRAEVVIIGALIYAFRPDWAAHVQVCAKALSILVLAVSVFYFGPYQVGGMIQKIKSGSKDT